MSKKIKEGQELELLPNWANQFDPEIAGKRIFAAKDEERRTPQSPAWIPLKDMEGNEILGAAYHVMLVVNGVKTKVEMKADLFATSWFKGVQTTERA